MMSLALSQRTYCPLPSTPPFSYLQQTLNRFTIQNTYRFKLKANLNVYFKISTNIEEEKLLKYFDNIKLSSLLTWLGDDWKYELLTENQWSILANCDQQRMIIEWRWRRKKCPPLSKLVQTLRERNIKPNLTECQMYFSWSVNVFLTKGNSFIY